MHFETSTAKWESRPTRQQPLRRFSERFRRGLIRTFCGQLLVQAIDVLHQIRICTLDLDFVCAVAIWFASFSKSVEPQRHFANQRSLSTQLFLEDFVLPSRRCEFGAAPLQDGCPSAVLRSSPHVSQSTRGSFFPKNLYLIDFRGEECPNTDNFCRCLSGNHVCNLLKRLVRKCASNLSCPVRAEDC